MSEQLRECPVCGGEAVFIVGSRVKVAEGIDPQYAGMTGIVVKSNVSRGWGAVKMDDTGRCWALPDNLVFPKDD